MTDIELKCSYSVPSTGNEMETRQLEYLARLLLHRRLSPAEVKVRMLLHCLGARLRRSYIGGKTLLCMGREAWPVDTATMTDLSAAMDFLTADSGKGRTVCDPALTRQPYPLLRAGGRQLHGAADNLYSLTFGQYMYLLTYLDAASGDPMSLAHALSCVWTSGKTFDIDRADDDADHIRRLPLERQTVMYWFVSGSLSALADQFPRLFGRPVAGGGVMQRMGGNVLDRQLRLLDALAGGDVTKKDLVRDGLLMDALYTMDERVRQHEEQERIINKNRS